MRCKFKNICLKITFNYLHSFSLKVNKTKDQYRLFYRELEQLIQLNAHTPHHKNLLESLQSLRAAYGDASNKSDPSAAHLRSYTESPLSPERLEPTNSVNSSSSSILKASKRRMSGCGQRYVLG